MTRSQRSSETPVGMVDEQPHELAADDLREQHLDVRLGVGQAGLDLVLDRLLMLCKLRS